MKREFSLIFGMAFLAVVSGQAGLLALQELIARGVVLNPDGKTFNVGLVGVPVDFLCGTELPEACRLCHIDCQQAHGAATGVCATIDDKLGCRCDYSSSTAAPNTCPSYTSNLIPPPLLPGLPDLRAETEAAVDAVLTNFLRTRYSAILCGPILNQTISCNVECHDNHAAITGTCKVPPATSTLIDPTTGYCVCQY